MITGGARPPILVLAMGGAFVLLVIALLIGSLTRPEFPPYALTTPHPAGVGDSLVGPATYTLDAAATDRWRRFDFGRNAAVDSGPWDLAFRRFHLIAAPGGGMVDLGAVPFDSVRELPVGVLIGRRAQSPRQLDCIVDRSVRIGRKVRWS